jgi:transposase-like protein
MKCVKCASEKQIKRGFTASGIQRYSCRDCGKYYVAHPKRYTEAERAEAIKLLLLGNSGRAVGKMLKMSKCNAYRWAKKAALKKEEQDMGKSEDH